MSELLDVQQKLQDTVAMLAELERAVAARPDDPYLALNMKSIQKRRRQLEEQFSALAETSGVDVCNYVLLPQNGDPELAGVTSALSDYQNLVTIFYDVVKNRTPKRRANVSAEVVRESSFQFGYAYAGSIGFVLRMPNERLMLGETNLDEAMRLITEVAHAEKPEDVLTHARKLGPAPIRILYKWAEDHVKSAFSAQIEWRRGQAVHSTMLMQKPEFERLLQIISQTTEEETEQITITGVLLGINIKTNRFELQPDVGDDQIKGSLRVTLDLAHPAPVPGRYRATISKTTVIRYSTEEEKPFYELLRLDPA
jgi:hypothetical protein